MEYVNLESYAARMVELARNDQGLKPHRLKAEKDRLANEMQRILKPSVRRLASRKNMPRDMQDEIDQHTFIAICKALGDWDPAIATFSTHVHWKVRAELQSLQHFEFPDRRRLATPQRISFLELDRPYTGDDGSTYTMADYLVDETAEDMVESEARRHVAIHTFERVFSHAIARQMQQYCIGKEDQQRIANKRHSLMRNRWIYIRRTLGLETYEQIAQEYNITRERARQIIMRVDEEMRGQLPRFCKTTNQVISASRRPPEDVHPSWDYMLIDFYMATGEDTRLVGRGSPMPSRVDSYDFRPEIRIATQTTADMAAELALPTPPVGERTDNVVPMPSRFGKIARHAAVAIVAGNILTAAVAANAQSRAIPPEDAPVAAATVAKTAPVAKQPVVHTRPVVRSSGIVAMEHILVDRPSWGVRVAEYASAQQARSQWTAEPKTWQWLRGLRAAYIAPTAGTIHSVAFGPLTERQAAGMCHEARRYSKPCQVVRFGVERQAARGGRDHRA